LSYLWYQLRFAIKVVVYIDIATFYNYSLATKWYWVTCYISDHQLPNGSKNKREQLGAIKNELITYE